MLKIHLKNNKHNAVWLVEPKVSIGRASDNDFVIDDPSVAANHVNIEVKHENLILVNISGGKQVTINGKIIEQSAPLKAEDELVIGGVQLDIVDPKREQRLADAASTHSTAVPEPTGWALKANHQALANRVFPIKPETVIGRSNDCDITLAAAHLSRRHVKLSIQDGLLYAKDLGSANGTYLNGKRVVGEERVRRGDELRFDTLSFGVIGPTQDLDKTTIRPAPAIPAAAITPGAKVAPPRPNQAKSPATKLPASADARVNQEKTNPASISSSATAKEGGSKGALVWVLVIVVLVASGVGVAFKQGLLGG